MNVFRLRHLIFPASLLIIAGCGKPATPVPPAGHALPSPLVAKCDVGQPGGRLTLVTPGAPNTFNPVLTRDGDAASDQVMRLIFGSLVSLDLVTTEIRPCLAESWSVLPDGKTWTFKLRPGLHWSDGHPLTADDVVFTWNEVMYHPDMNRNTYEVFRINGTNFTVSKVDDLTVRVVTPEVFAPFVEYFGNVVILPKHMMGLAVETRRFLGVYLITAHPRQIVGCGPYRVKENKPGDFILFERNPEYWMTDKKGQRLPYFDEIMLMAGGPNAPATAFLAGVCDLFERGRPADYAKFKSAEAGGKFRIMDLGPGAEREFLWFNLNTGASTNGRPFVNPIKLKWFQNKKFRQAISCAIDRDRLAREVYDGRAQPIYGFLSTENQKWNNPNIPHYAYDPARARALLSEAGIQDRNNDGTLDDAEGHPIEFDIFSNAGNPQREKCTTIIAEELRKLGLKVNAQFVHFTNLVTKINRTFDYECALMGLAGGGVDPAAQMNVMKSSEYLHQWFPEQKTPATQWEARVDALMDAQMRTLDFAERKKYFDEVQMILAEEQPMIYTVAPFHFVAVRTNLANLRPSVLTPFRATWNVEELYSKKP